MIRIFGDANAYLDFYRRLNLRKVLPGLRDYGPFIFISRQIVDEFERNKLAVADAFLKEQLSKVVPAAIPELLTLAAPNPTIERAAKLQQEIGKLKRKEIIRSYTETLKAISESRDPVSRECRPLFNKAELVTQVQLSHARLRKEMGNRPGCYNDPLGDQVSWEQFLHVLSRGEEAWIVSRDTDFILRMPDGIPVLHPPLHSEIKQRTGLDPKVFVNFDDLGKAFKKAKPKQSAHVPNAKEFAKIQEEELRAAAPPPVISPAETATSQALATIAAASGMTPQQVRTLYTGVRLIPPSMYGREEFIPTLLPPPKK